ncbi:MAG TPA: sulfurtransferase complex subunit TusC [Patescibacteria group bacterium]|nr:sulfurtransferase complex subunit TusC [Patescibacteria group bacterium]
MAHKKILFVNRKAPYGTAAACETLEAALIAAAFDQEVHLAFLDDGVFQLVKHQQPAALGLKGFTEGFLDLAEYDIDHVWVEAESLAERGLSEHDLMIPVALLDRAAMAALMNNADLVFSA